MPARADPKDFIHPKLDQEITAIAGHYVFTKEVRMAYRNREVLYFLGYAVLNSSCCGVGGAAYALVAGFVKDWKYRQTKDSVFVSRVEPIYGAAEQREIRKIIQKKETIQQVTFS
jgi:hypothetical protein